MPADPFRTFLVVLLPVAICCIHPAPFADQQSIKTIQHKDLVAEPQNDPKNLFGSEVFSSPKVDEI
jgi:hypothetical protein